MFIAFWNFADPNIQKYIIDETGNGYSLYKGLLSDTNPNDPFFVYGQGYLFESAMYASATLPILLHNYPQFTWDVWVRR